MPDINFVRREIERMHTQVNRQRRDILSLQRSGIPTDSAEALLQRMLDRVDELCTERDMLKTTTPHGMKGKVLGGRSW